MNPNILCWIVLPMLCGVIIWWLYHLVMACAEVPRERKSEDWPHERKDRE